MRNEANCPVCHFVTRDETKPMNKSDLCHAHGKLWSPVQAMLKQCAKVTLIAVETGELDFLAEAFAQELTSAPHAYPHLKWLDPKALAWDVEKLLTLLLLDCRSITTTAERAVHVEN